MHMDDKIWLKGRKILFVEDDQFFADIISMKLRGYECVVSNVPNAELTLASLKKEKPDLIILDLMLPGEMDGFGILEKLKADPNFRDIPVVILSNLGRAEDIEKGMRLGANKYLTKAHVTTSDVIDSLESALGSIQA